MDPAYDGRVGQVIRVGQDYEDGPVVVADSVTALLRLLLEAQERGDEARLPDWRQKEEGRFHSLSEAVKSLPQVQRLTLAGEADLGPLRGAPRLHLLEISQVSSVDLAALADVPVESLHLDVGSVDLAPLAEHPTLRLLVLRSTDPVSLAPLRGCPRLYGLDLGDATVTDLDALAEVEGLLYLSLRHNQWQELRSHHGPIPQLAAAALAGDPSPAELVRWATDFAHGSPNDFQYHSGQVSG